MKNVVKFLMVVSVIFYLLIVVCGTGYTQLDIGKAIIGESIEDKVVTTDKVVGDVETKESVKTFVIKKEIEEDLKQRDLYKRIIQTIIVIVFGYLLMFILVRIINKKVKSLKARHVVRKNTIYTLTILMFVFIFFVWIKNLSTLTIFLGVAGAGIALALQEVLLCVAGWFLIIMRHPYQVGDRIEISGVKGDVIDIRLFQTSLLEMGNWVDGDQSTGRIVNIPNSAIFKKESYNYSRGFEFIWNEINILVTFESDWRRAEEIMLSHAKMLAEGMADIVKNKIESMTAHYMIYYDKLTPIVYVDIKDSGVQLSLRYLTEAKKRRSTNDDLCRKILDGFGKEDIVTFAYKTYRIVNQ